MSINTVLPLLLLVFVTGCANLNSRSDTEGPSHGKSQVPPGHLIPGRPKEDKDAGVETFGRERPSQASSKAEKPELYYGTGRFVKQGRASDRKGIAESAAGDITLNFEQADLREVVQTVLGELLDESYILDPAVKGKVTIQTGKSLRRTDLLPTLETLLRMNGAAMVLVDGIYRILPLSKAIQGQQVPRLADDSAPIPAGYALQVVPLKYIGVREMAQILQPLAPVNSVIRVDATRNLLVLGGTGGELAGLLETIQLFDVDWMEGLSVGFFPLKYAKVSSVTKELQAIVGSIDTNPLEGMFRVVPVDEAGGILVVTPQKRYLDRVAEWIPRLDRVDSQESGSGQKLYVYRVQNGEAVELADMLQQLFSASGATQKKSKSAEVAPGKTKKTLSSSTDSESKSLSSTSVARMTFFGAGGSEAKSEIRVVADDKHNSLVITATPSQYANMLDALEKLDVRQLQVMVEATIIEVALQDEFKYGLQWAFNSDVGSNYLGEGVLSSGTSTLLGNTLPGFNFSVLRSASDVRAVFNALAEDSLIRVLSSPSVMVLDNETASIQVGDEVPIIDQQRQSTTDSDSPIINSISYRETGVMLEVTPRVNPGGLVTLDVTQEVSDVSDVEASSTSGSPTISTRKINSTVAVKNGEVLVLGGLITDRDNEGTSGLPFLSKLPLIGWLFGQESSFSKRTELVVVLVPTVVFDSTDNRQVVESFRAKLQGLKGSF
ncbi:MAG: type II secretion system secretin GspD [Candidatus Thiodiazotropha lotti]|nr:type II secretion system secretin GspD [Candidatus Thiodiazotropha lotti]ODB98916.1 type II secretion system protein GspD [Candidatus Thiodiazotropha endoloripes]MCG7921772.1 type II secretion system secretin GspD [Candidatus Thiodiazotropha lotti]MCG8002060.1 type II secretion system secretin GspD [Candidatus Thiodiazotropha lotti]MCG8007699.1 type II secretion system secretin GspD [Candidatus Thiodiazotropha lotti]